MRTIENQSPPYEKADVESGMTIDRELKLLARSACVERDPLRAEIDYAYRCVAFGYNHGVFDLSVLKDRPVNHVKSQPEVLRPNINTHTTAKESGGAVTS